MNSNIDIYDAFIAAGVPEDKARAAAKAVPEQSNVATKADLAELETRITWKMLAIVFAVVGTNTIITLTAVNYMIKAYMGG